MDQQNQLIKTVNQAEESTTENESDTRLGEIQATPTVEDALVDASPDNVEAGPVADGVEVGISKKKKKKKSRKPASKRGLGKPTGLEEYNADGPLTVEEAQIDYELYDRRYPFTMRLMTAIQRYERRRRLQTEQRDAFYKYLVFGGIDVSPNMFQGLSIADRKDLDKEDLVGALAQTSISEDKLCIGEKDSIWTVDFEGVMKAFISRRVPQCWELATIEEVKMITGLLSNFMSYLLLHDVCPEYSEEILGTRNFLDKVAPVELWNIKQAERWLPGDFNIACSTLFGGFYAHNFDAKADWIREDNGEFPENVFLGMTEDEARHVMKYGIAAAGSEEQMYSFVASIEQNTIATDWVQEGAFEITKIFPVTFDVKKFYKENTPGFRPLGRVLAKKWRNPNAPDEDLTDAERRALKTSNGDGSSDNGYPAYEFFLEAQILQYCFVGMRLEAKIHKLNCGIMFIDTVSMAYCSFDNFIPNELMLDYVKPRALGVKAEEEAAEQAKVDWEAEQTNRVEDTDEEPSDTEALENDASDTGNAT